MGGLGMDLTRNKKRRLNGFGAKQQENYDHALPTNGKLLFSHGDNLRVILAGKFHFRWEICPSQIVKYVTR